jgi:nucleoside-diphosphate-sugar epimerase
VRVILLTGGSGVVGQALIACLRDAKLFCLARRNPVRGANVIQLAGDITRPRLGLTRSEYIELAGRIDLVIHAAAITDFAQPPEVIMQTNLDGTRNTMELADAANVPFYYVGTAFTHTRINTTLFDANAYETSKRAAEQLVRSGTTPHVIIRPSVVVGDSATGAISRFQGFHYIIGLLFKGLLPLGPAGPNAYVDFIPQDLVARVIAGLIERRETRGEYWLTLGERALTVQRLVDICLEHAMRLLGHRIERPRTVSPDMFDRLIRPVFLPALPPHMRQMFDRAIHLARYFNVDQTFPTSVPQLAAELGLGPLPSAELTLVRNLEYWVKRNAIEQSPA